MSEIVYPRKWEYTIIMQNSQDALAEMILWIGDFLDGAVDGGKHGAVLEGCGLEGGVRNDEKKCGFKDDGRGGDGGRDENQRGRENQRHENERHGNQVRENQMGGNQGREKRLDEERARDFDLKVKNHSRNGRFLSLHLSIVVFDENDRNSIFSHLSSHERVHMVL